MANNPNAILKFHGQGKRVCETAKLLQVSHPTVFKAIKRSMEFGHEPNQLERNRKEL